MKSYTSIHQNPIENVSVIGLGKLGAPFAACLAARGYKVIGVDVDRRKIEAIANGLPPVFEPGLKELLETHRDGLTATENYEKAILQSDATFILVPTPSDAHGGFSLEYVIPVCERIGEALAIKSTFHLVVLTSTVLPGTTENEIRRVLEKVSGKRCGQEFGLCYSPEFIALGTVIRDLLRPDFILIGESDPHSGDILVNFYKRFCENDPPIAKMNFVNAELTKLSVNTFVTMKITFANTLARICEQLPGADVDVVTSALGLDSRIGRKYLKGAIGYGGPCFPRDNSAWAFVARQLGSTAMLAEATDTANRQQICQLATLVTSKLPKGGVVGILGLAYKPDTDVVVESQGLMLAQILLEREISVKIYDPVAMANARDVLNNSAAFATSLEDCVQLADVIVVATPWEEFKRLSQDLLSRPKAPRVVIDCWRVLDPRGCESVTDYIRLGIGGKFPLNRLA